MTDRGPGHNTPPDSSATSPKPSTPSSANGSKIISLKGVSADDRVWVALGGGRFCLDALTRREFGDHDPVCTLSWTNADMPPHMNAAQLAVLLRVVNQHSKVYKLGSNSCYWYAYTVAEVIRRHFGAVQTECARFSDRGKYRGVKPNLEDAVEDVFALYKDAWTAVVQEAEQRAVSCIDSLPKGFTHLSRIGG